MAYAGFFRKRGLRDKVNIRLFTPEPQPMPVAGPALGDAVRQMLEQQRITFHPLHTLTRVDGAARELTFEGKEAVGNYRYSAKALPKSSSRCRLLQNLIVSSSLLHNFYTTSC
jgi:NADPH-dependent 2,4-dienoyl-CoA reductase/sulfur reductase-like enzyme